jgi:AraC-like DNA-binding protein
MEVPVSVTGSDRATSRGDPPLRRGVVRRMVALDGMTRPPAAGMGHVVHRVSRLPSRHTVVDMKRDSVARHLLRAKDFADTRYFEPLRVADLAAVADMSPSYFSRRFRQTFGEAPHQYLLTRRLERAAALLRTSDWTVARICFAVGWNSVGSFTTSFHRMFGQNPMTYRKSFPPADSWLRIPRCIAQAYGRPQNRTFREDAALGAS